MSDDFRCPECDWSGDDRYYCPECGERTEPAIEPSNPETTKTDKI